MARDRAGRPLSSAGETEKHLEEAHAPCPTVACCRLRRTISPWFIGVGATRVNVGFVGLGRMGLPMARCVLRSGFPLTVWNRSPQRCKEIAGEGAQIAASLAELGAWSEIVITMTSDASSVRAVLLGEDSLLDSMTPGSIVADMSTIGYIAALELAAAAEERRVLFLDAPVSGTIPVAEKGELLTMVGGRTEAFDRAREVLSAMTSTQLHLGPTGAGAGMKLAFNAVVLAHNEAVAEALVLAERLGIPPDAAFDVLDRGALSSTFLKTKRFAFVAPEPPEHVHSTPEAMRECLRLVFEIAERLDVDVPVVRAADSVLARACETGLGQEDIARVVDVIRRGNRPEGEAA